MAEIEIRNTISTDIARLSQLDHSIDTDYVWQLDLHREIAQVDSIFREVRLPRTIQIPHVRTAEQLPDEWHQSPMMSAMLGSEPVGYIRFRDDMVPHAVWITDIVVGRNLRRKGLGRKLIAAVEAWAIQRGFKRSIVEVQSKNHPAIRLIQKLGYEFCGYNDQYYTTRDIALFFARSI